MKAEDLIIGKSYRCTIKYLDKYNTNNKHISKHINNIANLIYLGKSDAGINTSYAFNVVAFGYFVDRMFLKNDDMENIEPSDNYLD